MNQEQEYEAGRELRQLLIVDDELAMRQALEASFTRAGWRVETAAGVAEALERAARQRFAVVLTDMRMLDGSGLELVRELRTRLPQTPLVVLTAYGSVPDAVEAMRSGACEYLIKPVSFERLEAVAERAWQRYLLAMVGGGGAAVPALRSVPACADLAPGLSLREVERRLLEATLRATGGNRTRAAEMLGVSLRTIRNKIRAYGLPPRRFA